jgi:hypothetical protein
MGCVPPAPFFVGTRPYDLLSTILRQAGTCAAVDAPDEVPTAMDAVLVEVSPRRTCSRSVTGSAAQCSSPFSTIRRA